MIIIARVLVALAVLLPMTACVVNRLYLNRHRVGLVFGLLTWLVCCILVWIAAFVLDIGLESSILSYDLNADGSISSSELTPAAQNAIDRWQSGTGRIFGPFLAVPVFGVWVGFINTATEAILKRDVSSQ